MTMHAPIKNMTAIVAPRYGATEVLEAAEVVVPALKDHEVLVEVRAAAVNPSDVHLLKGEPFFLRFAGMGLFRPKDRVPGSDVAGRVTAVGSRVREFRPGDEVFANLADFGRGAFAEYVIAPEAAWVTKPSSMSFAQAAAAPMAAVTALQGLRREGRIQSGHSVLINGASGGVGTFAVQIAKALGAEVTAVCSTRNVEMVRRIGANHVIDYTKEDFTLTGRAYDLIFDTVANRSIADYQSAMSERASFVTTGVIPGLMLRRPGASRSGSRTMRNMMATSNREDLAFVGSLLQSGDVVPVIDRCYPLRNVSAALDYVAGGHAQGKVVIEVGG